MSTLRARAAALAAAAALGLGLLSAGTAQAAAPKVATAPAVTGYSTITGTSVLYKGQAWYSPDHTTFLTMQLDGNAVLYHNGTALWQSQTVSSGNEIVMQNDGNLVVYTSNMEPIWQAGTYGHPGAALEIYNSGGMMLVQGISALWWAP
jgi:hypothetical protein